MTSADIYSKERLWFQPDVSDDPLVFFVNVSGDDGNLLRRLHVRTSGPAEPDGVDLSELLEQFRQRLLRRLDREVAHEHGSTLFFFVANFILRVFVSDLVKTKIDLNSFRGCLVSDY